MPLIPENDIEFLHWVKTTTESVWSREPSDDPTASTPEQWLHGAKWMPLMAAQIDSIEIKFGMRFMPEHRAFLEILHAIDRPEQLEWTETEDGKEVPHHAQKPFFYNWLKDEADILDKLAYPYRLLQEDVIKGSWLKSWGAEPETAEERLQIFEAVFKTAPQLIPLRAHQFLVNGSTPDQRPLLSTIGFDTVLIGWNFRHYLLGQLRGYLNTTPFVYNAEEENYRSALTDEIDMLNDQEWANGKQRIFPFWTELIAYYGRT